MWNKFSESGIAATAGQRMYVTAFEHRFGDAHYQDTFSNYRLEIPERRQSRKAKLGTKLMRVRIFMPRLRIRLLSPVQLFEKARDSYLRYFMPQKKSSDMPAVSSVYHYHHQTSYSSDAVAECIEFIKRSSSAVSQDARFL